MNFDWTKPVVIDWSGRRGPLISEDDIRSSVIKRILHNQFYPPFCERQYVPVKPWWNPQDPFSSNLKNNNSKDILFIPGLRSLPPYPQLSTLTKQQHLQGLRVMSTRFEFVQPRNYPQPTQKDIASVEEFQALYEAEQKEYLKWTKLLWMNGDCLRVLRPKPTIERVYDAEFRMRAHEMLSMPQQYTLAAQIPLQKEGDCEMELKEDLINVNIQDLPVVDYPEEMESELSVLMKSCPVPEPCKEHPCKFVLPHEETVSVLPLAEIHRELAQYAASNGSTFVASENALRSLLDTDRSWKIPVSVVEVICPEYGDLKTIVVLGSEINAQKECSTQRTYKAYKHLLRHTFAPSIGQYKSKSPTKQSTSPQKLTSSPPAQEEPIILPNNLIPLTDDLEVSSDEDTSEKLLIADAERKNDPKKLLNHREPKEPDRINSIEKRVDQCMTEPESHEFIDHSRVADHLIVDNPKDSNPVPSYLDSYKPVDKGVTEPDNSHKRIDEPSSDSDQLTIDNFSENNLVPSYDLDSEAFEQCAKKPDNSQEHMDESRSHLNLLKVDGTSNTYSVPNYGLDFYEPDYNKDSTKSYSHNEPFRLMDNASKPESSCGLDFYQPDYSINTRPNYSRDNDDPSSEPDKLIINNPIIMNPESINTSSQYYEASSRNSDVSNYDRPSYRYYDASDEPASISESNPENNSVLDFHELDCDTRPRNDESSEPDETMMNDQSNSEINDSSAIETHDSAPIFKITDVPSEINEETFQMLQTSDILGTGSTTVLDTYKNLPPSLNFETKTALNVNDNVATTNTSLVDNKNNKSIAPINCEDNQSKLGSEQCEKQNVKPPKTPSPIKPCRISVTNLSIPELKVKNIVALLNKPNTEVPSVTQINDDVSIFNEATEKFEGPARLGISGIISRNPSSIVTNKTIVNNPVVQTDEVLRLGNPKHNNNKSSLKESDSKYIEIGNTTQVVPAKIGPSTIVTRNRSISGTLENTKAMIEKTKEVPKSSEITRRITRNRSLCGTDNKGVNEKSKELTPKLEKSRMINKNQNAKVKYPMTENDKKVSSLGIAGMITSYCSLSGTEEVLEKSEEVTPKLEMSKKKNRNQRSSICKKGNIEKANEVSSLAIAGMITRNRSLSATEEVLEKSKEVTPKLEMSKKKNRNQKPSICTSRKIDDPIIENANEDSSLGIAGMITRNRSLTGTEVEQSKEVTPNLEKSMKKNINQTSSMCTSRNIDVPFIEKANEVATLGISRVNTRNRSLSATNNGTEDIKHTEKSSKKTGDINKNLTSPKKLSKNAVSIAPVGNVYTRTSQHLDIATNKHSSENLIHVCDKDEVNVNALRRSIELSPVKPCSVSVKPIDIEPYVRKSISETNISGIEKLDKSPLKTHTNNIITKAAVDDKESATIETLQSATKTRKRSIIESNSEVLVIERHRYANLKTYSRNKNAAKKKKPRKPSIKTSTISLQKCFIETENNCILDDSNQPSAKRVRKLSEQVIIEHDYCTIAENSKEPRKLSISEIEHDYCGSDPSCDEESDTNMLFVDCVPAVDKYTKNFDILEETFDASIFNNKILEGNITSSKPSSSTRSRKISFSALFGDDSDSDEPIVQNSKTGRNQKYGINKLCFTDPIEKSPIKPCIRKSINDSPRNSKRKLSFSDPLTSDPEFNTCVSEVSEDSIAGFYSGVAVPCKTLTKNIKKKETIVNRTYVLCSRKTNTRTAKKSNIAQQKKENGRFTKIIPDKQTNARNIHRSSDSNSESDDTVSSRQNSLVSKQNINTNKQKIQITSLRRSRRLSTRTNADNSDQLNSKKPTAKTNAKDSSEITKGRRFSDRSSTKENVQQNNKDTQYDFSKSLSKNTSKIFKRDKNRRKSLPSNIFSETSKTDLILRSKSLTNLNEKTDKRTRHLSETNLYSTRSITPKKNRSDSLKLSERTKRYLRRVFNFECSDSDQSDDEISQRTEISAGTEKSDTENKKTRRFTRSSILNNNETMKTRSRNKTDYIEKTKRFTRRSAAAYSSCDKMELSPPVRRIKTKRTEIVNTNCSTNTVALAESNTEQFETDEIKTEPETEIDTTENVEKFQIEIDVIEETKSVDSETLPGLHFIELPTNSCEGNTSQANGTDENLNMSNNETDIEFGSHRSTDAIIITNEFEMNQREPNENSKEIQQFQNMDTNCIDASPKTLENSADADSDSDFFNMCVNDEFNILHFTATNESDSEDEALSIDDSQSNTNVTDTVKQSMNSKPKNIQPKTPETVKCNLFGESSNQTEAPITRVENIKTQASSITPTKNIRSKDEFASTSSNDLSRQNKALVKKSLPKDIVNDVVGVFNCTCKDTPFEVPPPRSFKKWRVRNTNSQIGINVIVHSSHRVRKGTSEVLLEPIVEYQPELGGSRQPRGRLRATALALMLRQNAKLINVRIDHDNGNVIVIDQLDNDEFIRRHGDQKSEVSDTLYTALDQLRFLMPGQYVLAHDPSHGTNAMLYTRKGAHDRGDTLSLQPTNINMPDAEDALLAKIPPQLDIVILPYHKYHSILPLSFTPHRLGIREEQKMAAALARAKPPPSAIQEETRSKIAELKVNVHREQQLLASEETREAADAAASSRSLTDARSRTQALRAARADRGHELQLWETQDKTGRRKRRNLRNDQLVRMLVGHNSKTYS